MSLEFLDYVEDMLDAMDKAEFLLVGVSYQQFVADFRINFAAVRALEIIDEVARRIPSEVQLAYPAIEWKGIIGMRNRIVHGYDKLDFEIIWQTIQNDIPTTRLQLQQILQDYGDQS